MSIDLKNRPSSASSSQSGGGASKGFQKRAATPTGAGSGLAELMRSNPATFSFDTHDFSMDIFPSASSLTGENSFSMPSPNPLKRSAIPTHPTLFRRTGENPVNARGIPLQVGRPRQVSAHQPSLSTLSPQIKSQRFSEKEPDRVPNLPRNPNNTQINIPAGSVPTSSLSSAVTSPAATSTMIEVEDTDQFFARVQEIKTEAFQIFEDYENNFHERMSRIGGCKRKSSELIERTEQEWAKIVRRKSTLKESVELLR